MRIQERIAPIGRIRPIGPGRSAGPWLLALLLAASLGLGTIGCVHPPRWGDPLSVTEIVELSRRGVPPEKIVAKMERSGLVYKLTEAQYANLRRQGVTPVVIIAMQQTYVHAVEQHPRLASEEHIVCFSLGFDGYWYAGGPWGLHPDC